MINTNILQVSDRQLALESKPEGNHNNKPMEEKKKDKWEEEERQGGKGGEWE